MVTIGDFFYYLLSGNVFNFWIVIVKMNWYTVMDVKSLKLDYWSQSSNFVEDNCLAFSYLNLFRCLLFLMIIFGLNSLFSVNTAVIAMQGQWKVCY